MIYLQVLNNLKYLLGDDWFKTQKFAIAVSAGPDSIFLSVMLRKLFPKSNITILTVNHNVRDEVQIEIKYIKSFALSVQAEFALLQWDGQGCSSNFQAKAREARYNLLTDKCHELGIDTLFVAHHKDDYIENYLIRQKRKSGILGLSSNYINFVKDIRIVKPMFNISKEEILSFLDTKGIEYFLDESNYSPQYLRNRVRMSLTGAVKDKVYLEMVQVNVQAKNLQKTLIMMIAESVQIFDSGFAKIELAPIISLRHELQIQILIYVITVISGKKATPRYRNICNILRVLNQINFVKNLHNIFINKINSKIFVYQDLYSCDKTDYLLDNLLNAPVIWDNRFIFKTIQGDLKSFDSSDNMDRALKVSYLYKLFFNEHIKNKEILDELLSLFVKRYNLQDVEKNKKLYKKILFTFPVVFNLEKSLIIPHIKYNGFQYDKEIQVIFRPNFIFRFTHYLSN